MPASKVLKVVLTPKNLEVDGITVDATNEVEPALMPPTIKDGGYHWLGCHQQWRSGPALSSELTESRQKAMVH